MGLVLVTSGGLLLFLCLLGLLTPLATEALPVVIVFLSHFISEFLSLSAEFLNGFASVHEGAANILVLRRKVVLSFSACCYFVAPVSTSTILSQIFLLLIHLSKGVSFGSLPRSLWRLCLPADTFANCLKGLAIIAFLFLKNHSSRMLTSSPVTRIVNLRGMGPLSQDVLKTLLLRLVIKMDVCYIVGTWVSRIYRRYFSTFTKVFEPCFLLCGIKLV